MSTQRKSKSRKKNTKNKQNTRSANRKMIAYFINLVLIFFAITHMGVFGVTLYNLVRLLTGSVAYLLLALILTHMWITLFKKEWFMQNKRLVPGVSLMYFGLLLIVQGIFASAHGNDNALWHVLDDMAKFDVTKYAGAGFIGWLLYIPFKTLFSTIGVYIVGALWMLIGFYAAAPGLIEKSREALFRYRESQAVRKKEKRDMKKLVEISDEDEEEKATLSFFENEELQKEDFSEELLKENFSENFFSEELQKEDFSDEEWSDNEPQNFDTYHFDTYHYEEKNPNPLGLITDHNADWNDIYQPEENEETSEKTSRFVTNPTVSRFEFDGNEKTSEKTSRFVTNPTVSRFGFGGNEKISEKTNRFVTNPTMLSRLEFDGIEINNDLAPAPIEGSDVYFENKDNANNADNADNANNAGHYQLPTSNLLTPIPSIDQSKEMRLVKKNSRILEETLRSFKISAKVVSSVVGPSVTRYEIKLAIGVKVARILNLTDDLALALAAKDVRIEAPIPGKSLVGVEIPNSEIAMVGFRDMWEHAQTNPKKLLEVPLGKAFDGSARTFDLAKMPHLLVAGSTGSGKSVAVNGIITSILMKALPSQVKFLMVDPKMVELSVYNDIPHLLIPVVTNPRKAARALQKVVDEMEDRYELFSGFGVRNIEGYNEKVEKLNNSSDVKYQLLPLIVVIVDELADLMMVASKEVEDAIIRLGQKARAAGIHMLLATQRPSVDVISGLIKANVPSRVAFAVSSGTDSRTILDVNGAEKLLGRGDMLFKPIDKNHPIRLQGAYISDSDVESIVSFIKQQSVADYDESFDPGEKEGDNSRNSVVTTKETGDPLFEEAKQLVASSQRASTAQLQRAFKIGFNRASDLMKELENARIVGPAKGTTPRKVLIATSGEFLADEE